MVLLTHCCCCIPLRAGCFIIAVLTILTNIMSINERMILLNHLGPEDNEDDENRRQRNKVKIVEIIWILESILLIIVSGFVIYAAVQKIPPILKICAGIYAFTDIVDFLFVTLIIPGVSSTLFKDAMFLAFRLYLYAAIYSYGQELEEPPEPQITVMGRAYMNPEPVQIRPISPRYTPQGHPYYQGPWHPTYYSNRTLTNFQQSSASHPRPLTQEGNDSITSIPQQMPQPYSPSYWSRRSPS